jgi:hypothetical protein
VHLSDCAVENDCVAAGLDLDLPLGRKDVAALQGVLSVERDCEGLKYC